jgi:hypothetical protein
MLESHSSYGSQLSACQSWLPDFLTSTTNPVSATAAAQAGKVQAARAVQAGGQPCLQAAECSDEVRICAHCGTSKTPLWRNGPQGPKVYIFYILLTQHFVCMQLAIQTLVSCDQVMLNQLVKLSHGYGAVSL